MAGREIFLGLLLAAMATNAGDAWHEPASGNAERRQVMDGLRDYMSQFDARPLVFVVRELCLGTDRGWVSVDPQSPDGRSHYEPLKAVLERKNFRWRVLDLACDEAECPSGTDPEALRASVAPGCR